MKRLFCFLLVGIMMLLSVAPVSNAYNLGSGVEVVASECELIKTGYLGTRLCFSDSDIKKALAVTDFKSITITKLPSLDCGTLMLGDTLVSEGLSIKRREVAKLSFVPKAKDVSESEFYFTVENMLGGNEIKCRMRFVEKTNYTPKIDESDTSVFAPLTQRDISCFGTLKASDEDGDEVEFMVISYPKFGTLTEFDAKTGKYRYTPKELYIGKDKFIFVVRDEYGNYTAPKTVEITVTQRQSEAVYVDMENREEYNAAVALTGMGIMSGYVLGDNTLFNPDGSVSRAEFVAMAMKAYGIRADSSIEKSFFDDNEEIPKALLGYVATAQRLGIVNGAFNGRQLLFRPNDTVTKLEAARIISNIIGKGYEGEALVFADISEVPVWARESVYTVYSLGIFDKNDTAFAKDTPLTRAETAKYIYNMIRVG